MTWNIDSGKLLGFMMGILMCTLVSCGTGKTPITIISPDGRIKARVMAWGGENRKTLMYDVLFDDVPVVTQSPLGIVLKNGDGFSEDLTVEKVTFLGTDVVYSMPYGKTSEIRDYFKEATIELEDKNKRKINLIFRAYNDGIAFRYYIPVQKTLDNIEITGELTSFYFTGDHDYWGLHLDSYTTSYETDYTASKLGAISPQSLIALPLLIRASEKSWAAITEANLTDYAGMYLKKAGGKPSGLTASLSPLPDSSGVCARIKTPHGTPWRVLMIGEQPGDLIESNIVLNLNAPCVIDNSWIQPGKVAWDWWSGQVVKDRNFKGAMDDRTMKYFIDFAGDYGLRYMLVDAGWYGDHADGEVDITKSIPQIDVPGLVQYAGERGVGIILWLNWKCVDRQMDEAFPLYEKWGVKGVKIDYMNRDDQEMVNFYHRAVQKAAAHKLLVDFHGAYKPTGIRRTYPNLITREGVMGLEYSKWSDRITPDHDCTLPFTRMLAGPMDYTPGGFSNATKEQFKPQSVEPMTQGTRCHQLALYVIFESPLQMLADHPANYRNKPGMDFLEAVPVTWDKTRVIAGEVGDFIAIARQYADEWYLGSITDWTPRLMTVSLDFLGEGDYAAEIYADGSGPEDVRKREVLITAGDSIDINMAAGGGCAVRFYPAPAGCSLPRYSPK
ncbi:glycoside hydrolase family 97 protein [bacterium]|nr:glycoside hydrolase family 97 protein [bacterium]